MECGGSGAVGVDTAIGQLVNEAVPADEVIDVYKLAGVDTPEISILSDEFLDSVAHRHKPNLQLGVLRRIRGDRIPTISHSNPVRSRKFSEQLEKAINKYTNRSLTTAEIIAELVKVAKEMRDQAHRHDELGLSEAEAAFYEAIVQNESAVLEVGDEKLKKIAHYLVWSVQSSMTIDGRYKESVKAGLRSKVRRLLVVNGRPPNLEAKVVELVLEQAELFAGTG